MKTFKQFFTEALEPKLIVIFPGRFQPMHKGHKQYYESAKSAFPGAHFYIATSSNIHTAQKPAKLKGTPRDPDKYPFSFEEKKQIMKAEGINESEIVECVEPYKPVEILSKYNKDTDKVIFLVGKKDMEEDPRFQFKPTASGAPSYYQPFESVEKMAPFKPVEEGGHGYVYAPGTIKFSLLGNSAASASDIRAAFREAAVNNNEELCKDIVTDVIGSFNEEIYNLFKKKLLIK